MNQPATPPDDAGARRAILGRLRAAQARAQTRPDPAPFEQGPFGAGAAGPRTDPALLLEPFERAATAWRAQVVRSSPQDWPQAVQTALVRAQCRRVAIGAGEALGAGLERALQGIEAVRFERAIEHWKRELFDSVDAAVTDCAAGIADTGTLVLCPGPGEPRTLSLVPPFHVAVLRASRLFASFAALVRAEQPQRDLPTNWLLVSGPSKTADIQQTLAYGAHGPKALTIVLVDDLVAHG